MMKQQNAPKVYHRDHLIPIFRALGWKTAPEWSNKRLQNKLSMLPDVYDDSVVMGGLAAILLHEILDDLKKGTTIHVVGMP